MAVMISPKEPPPVLLSRELGKNAVRHAVSTGLVQVARGVFVDPLDKDEPPWHQTEHLALARVAGVARRTVARPVFSHRTAALLHGLWLVDDDTLVHTSQKRLPSRSVAGRVRHVRDLPADDVTEVSGLRVTTIERTIVDCAKSMHPRHALVIADSGMRALVAPRRDTPSSNAKRTATLRARLLAMVEQGDRRHLRRARAVVTWADPLAESPYETILRWVGVSRGLPRPVLQPRYEVEGHVYYPDVRWRLPVTEHGALTETITLLGEYDGEVKFLPDDPDGADARRRLSARVMAERRRQNRLASLPGTTVERFDRTDLSDEDAVFRRLCRPFPPGWVATLSPVPELLGTSPRR
ncbi:hypothetical protein [Oceanitalea stevensii]|uniref:Transcriptional regulator, AbiEi antitoxin, Type IV TA system n=1 Tax=Oceanitalea stevensii TaxID=2763072 RepID=A0ABR8Z3W6_9MICO|nr:hypothetical protein [Oceanitalea stevensii]MBD8062611.1 hypothetical protein [Oceanitalea stevensii]